MLVDIQLKKTHPDAVLPQANNPEPGTGDTGFDLTAVETTTIPAKGSAVVPVGLTLARISPGYWIRIEPRSGLGFKHNIQPHLGVIDNGYRGDLGVKLYNFGDDDYIVEKLSRIAQLVVYPLIQPAFSFTDHVSESVRGDKGFGSSDISETDSDEDEQINDGIYIYRDGKRYILNPARVCDSDPEYILDSDDTITTSDESTTYITDNV